jgi:NADPH2:quinone reductase
MRGFITDPSAPGGLRFAEDLPEREPEANELLLEVRAFSVNRGELASLQRNPDGWRPGQDVAGVVLAQAADGSGPRKGARVVGIVPRAGWAERVPVETLHAAVLPDAVSFEQAATLPIAGLTALRALRAGGSLLGRRVLVTGATGGVGQFAVQLAVTAGAFVTAHVSGPDREEEARSLGAQQVVWSLEGESLGRFDFVADGVCGSVLKAAVHRLAPGGTAVTYGVLDGPAELSLADFAGASHAKVMGLFHNVPEDEKGADLATLARLIAEGRLRPRISLLRDWSETRDVLDALRKRQVRGKAVLTRT